VLNRKDETICAPATGKGGAIAIIRISGPQSIAICDSIFRPATTGSRLSGMKGYTIAFGEITEGDEPVDEVLVSIFRAPHSYTGEDSAEISCHASSYIQGRILELLIKNGALAALPGEFTQRAFINGKLDLSQAEAVADLIASHSAVSHRLALNQMKGGFSAEISKLRAELLHFVSLIELELDFGEEDVEFADRKQLLVITSRVRTVASQLASSFLAGNVIKNGIPVAIVGKPNSGKSTLLNKLLKEERAIVSEIPGTTRDVIEDSITVNGIEYRFIDTAGIRETDDIIEALGIVKTHEKIAQASVILLVDEASGSAEEINSRAARIRQTEGSENRKLFILVNKSDLAEEKSISNLKNGIKPGPGDELLFISAKNGEGLDALKALLEKVIEKDRISSGNVVITNIRHYEALNNVSLSLERVEDGLRSGIPEDLIAMDIRHAIHYLGEITGEITTDEILGNIFKNFCIGK
jgi:tRNA modification GTPase